jgi:hypothetical protein
MSRAVWQKWHEIRMIAADGTGTLASMVVPPGLHDKIFNLAQSALVLKRI